MDVTEKEAVLLEWMARKLCLIATCNCREALLAPYALFMRHGDLLLRAATVEPDGAKPRELKLGTFKVAGLGRPTLTRKLFRAHPELIASSSAREGEAEVVRIAPSSVAAYVSH